MVLLCGFTMVSGGLQWFWWFVSLLIGDLRRLGLGVGSSPAVEAAAGAFWFYLKSFKHLLWP